MTAIAWTLVGLMAASLGLLSAALYFGLARVDTLGTNLGGRIDTLGARLDGRIDAVGAHVDGRMDALDARLDAQGAEIRADIRELRMAVASLDQRLTRSGS